MAWRWIPAAPSTVWAIPQVLGGFPMIWRWSSLIHKAQNSGILHGTAVMRKWALA
ncbi:MAG TPA: hypothetical protein VMV49_07130 [Candidatus Deferrimicrobium sp.]|nr:hypothetical protein [Candidatus Deferrimicrobium sp.]